jgi:hypothetical protein
MDALEDISLGRLEGHHMSRVLNPPEFFVLAAQIGEYFFCVDRGHSEIFPGVEN